MWEYRVEIVDVEGPYNTRTKPESMKELQVMQKLGAEGWECFYAVSVRSFVGSPELRMYFKRLRKA